MSERVFLYRYLANIMEAGETEARALKYYLEDVKLGVNYQKAFKKALFLVGKGNNLVESLYQCKIILQDEYTMLHVLASNKGAIPSAMLLLAQAIEEKQLFSSKLKSMLVYPSILLAEFFIILMIYIFWLAPAIHSLLLQLNTHTPFVLRVALFLNNGLRSAVKQENILWLIVVLSCLWLMYQLLQLNKVRFWAEALFLRLYKVGDIYQLFILQDFFRKFDLMACNDCTTPKRLRIVARACMCTSLVYSKIFSQMAQHLEKGGLLPQFYERKKMKRYFPVLVLRFFLLEERVAGRQEGAIQSILKYLSDELDIKLKRFFAFLEPALIISLAIFVALVALSVQRIIQDTQQAIGF